MPQRQQTQGDFGIRPVRPQQQLTDTYSAPSLPKPDLSVYEGIAKLSDTGMQIIDFKQKQDAYQKKAGMELGEAQPDYKIGRGSTEAAMAGFQEGRGISLRNRFQTSLESTWKVATATNEYLLDDTTSYQAYHDSSLQEFVNQNGLEGIALSKFLEGSDDYRTRKTADHAVSSLGFKKKLFLQDADDVVLSSFTHMENEAEYIKGLNLFDLITATDDLVGEDGSLSLPTSIYELTPEDIANRTQKLRSNAAISRVQDIQEMFDGAHFAGPATLKDVETRLITGFMEELTNGSNPDMAYSVMNQLTSGTGRFIDRPAVMAELRRNEEDILKNVNGLKSATTQQATLTSWIQNRGATPMSELADGLGVAEGEAKGVLEEHLSTNSYEVIEGRRVFSPNKFSSAVSDLAGLEKLPKLGVEMLDSISIARNGIMRDDASKQKFRVNLETFKNLVAKVGKERTKDLLSLNDSQYNKLEFMEIFVSEKDDEGNYVHTIEQLQYHAALTGDLKNTIGVPSDGDFKEAMSHAGDSIWFRGGFAPLSFLLDDDADIIAPQALELAKRIYNAQAIDPANADYDESQILTKTVEYLSNMGYEALNNRLVRTTPEMTVDKLEKVETQARRNVVNSLRTQKREFKEILKQVREENPFKKKPKQTVIRPLGLIGEAMGVPDLDISPFMLGLEGIERGTFMFLDTAEESEWKEITKDMTQAIWEERNPNKNLSFLHEQFEDFDIDEWLEFDDDEDDINLIIVSDHTSDDPRYRFLNPTTGNPVSWGQDNLRDSWSAEELDRMYDGMAVVKKDRRNRNRFVDLERLNKAMPAYRHMY